MTLSSCRRDVNDGISPENDETPVTVRLSMTTESDPDDTKSIYSSTDANRLNNVVIYGVDETTGYWKRTYISSVNIAKPVEMTFFGRRNMTFYVLGNMGNVQIPTNAQGRLSPESFAYDIPSGANLSISGFPMAQKVQVTASQFDSSFHQIIPGDETIDDGSIKPGTGVKPEKPLDPGIELPGELLPIEGQIIEGGEIVLPLTIKLQRLLAKVNVSINKTDISGSTNAPVLSSGTIGIRQANRHLVPFATGGSYARSTSDLFSYDVFDSEDLSSQGSALQHSNIVLYVPENRQGVLLNNGAQEAKTWDELPSGKAALCTYIEYQGSKNGAQDGVAGPLRYRAYLGGNVTNDFSVVRNTSYKASLTLTWDGLMWDADGWRIDTEDMTDGRRIVLSSTNNSGTAISGNSLGKIRRDDYKDVYVNFSRDGGNSWVHGLKDLDGWPYGWDLYIDGIKQTAGEDGVAAGDIEWEYYSGSGTSTTDMISIYPGTNSVVRSTHTLQVRSADGKVSSNIVRFDIGGKPLGLFWSGKAPQYVAQRGMLAPDDLESSSATVVYTVINGADKVRLSSAGSKNSRMVNILGSGTVTIQAVCEATDQDDEITFTVQAPQLSLGATAYYANPDGAEACTATSGLSGSNVTASYSGASGALTRRATATTATAVGSYLAADLYDELLAFVPSVNSPLLESSCSTGYGTITLHTKALSSGSTSYPTTAATNIGTLTVSAKGTNTGVSPASAVVRSVNPFSAFTSSVALNTEKDIHDFSVIGYDSYSASGRWGFSSESYLTNLPSTNATSTYVGFEAFVNDAATAEPALSAQFSKNSSGKVTWSNVITTRADDHTAGVFSLKAYVQNRYSQEKRYSPVFYKGRLFRHGAVIGYETPGEFDENPWSARSTSVSVRYYKYYTLANDRAYYYPSDGLGCAFPDVGTHRTNETIYIEWSNYESHMEKYDGELIIYINPDPRPVKAPESSYLYDVTDGCDYAHATLITSECHEGHSGTNPKMYFCAANNESKYKDGHIKRINENLVYLHPDGAPTTTVSGYTVGYYVLHTNQYVENIWL